MIAFSNRLPIGVWIVLAFHAGVFLALLLRGLRGATGRGDER